MRSSSLSNTSSASSGPPASRNTTQDVRPDRLRWRPLPRASRSSRRRHPLRGLRPGRRPLRSPACGAGVGAGRPWMHWDLGRSHSSQYSSAIRYGARTLVLAHHTVACVSASNDDVRGIGLVIVQGTARSSPAVIPSAADALATSVTDHRLAHCRGLAGVLPVDDGSRTGSDKGAEHRQGAVSLVHRRRSSVRLRLALRHPAIRRSLAAWSRRVSSYRFQMIDHALARLGEYGASTSRWPTASTIANAPPSRC